MHVSFLVDSLGPRKVITNSYILNCSYQQNLFCFLVFLFEGEWGEEKGKKRFALQFPAN